MELERDVSHVKGGRIIPVSADRFCWRLRTRREPLTCRRSTAHWCALIVRRWRRARLYAKAADALSSRAESLVRAWLHISIAAREVAARDHAAEARG